MDGHLSRIHLSAKRYGGYRLIQRARYTQQHHVLSASAKSRKETNTIGSDEDQRWFRHPDSLHDSDLACIHRPVDSLRRLDKYDDVNQLWASP